ncbi:MAG: hypothetical protein SFU91_11440 [Chloroherpetonaceae bacterium]|nr:hypothetical protein [Chloroherpetonaceae bacterium]
MTNICYNVNDDQLESAFGGSNTEKVFLNLKNKKYQEWEEIIDNNGFSRNNLIVGVVVPGYEDIIYREYHPNELYELYLGYYHNRYLFEEYISAIEMTIQREVEYFHIKNIINFLTLPYSNYEALKKANLELIGIRKLFLISYDIDI